MLLPSVPPVAAFSAACVSTENGSSQRVSLVPEKPHTCKRMDPVRTNGQHVHGSACRRRAKSKRLAVLAGELLQRPSQSRKKNR